MFERTLLRRAAWCLVTVALAAPTLALSQSNDSSIKKVALEMYLDQETVSNPRIAPDGQRIAVASKRVITIKTLVRKVD